jgi:two-component system CheB/CheR fusion protein
VDLASQPGRSRLPIRFIQRAGAKREPGGASRPEPSPEDLPTGSGPPPPHAGNGVPIVGIGASAGGLTAHEACFSAVPPDLSPPMAFAVVQHLSPD